MKRFWLVCMFLFTASFAFGQEEMHLTLQDAVDLALANSNALQISTTRIDAADHERLAAISRIGPVLKAEGNILFWDEPFEIEATDLIEVPEDLEGFIYQLTGPMDPIEVHEQTTSQFTLTLAQPITPLYSIGQGIKARSQAKHAQENFGRHTQNEVTLQAITAFHRLCKYKELEQVAQAAVNTIQAHVEQARNFRENELIGRSEVLTAEVALAESQEKLLQVQTAVALSRSALAKTIGLPIESPIDVVTETDMIDSSVAYSLEHAQSQAVEHRGDLAALENKAKAIKALERVAWWGMVPQLLAIGRYQMNDGSILLEDEELFVGLTLSWEAFEWGRKYHEGKAARARSREAVLANKDAKDLVQLQVKQFYMKLETAAKRISVTEKAVALAEEDLRIRRLQFEETMATSVDVLDAQTRLSQAKSNRVIARYDLLNAQAGLRFSLGDNPQPNVAESQMGDS